MKYCLMVKPQFNKFTIPSIRNIVYYDFESSNVPITYLCKIKVTKDKAKVPILKEVNFGKVKLWDVEHFWTLFFFTFGRDCYCIQQSRPKMKTKSVQKCSTSQSFTFPK